MRAGHDSSDQLSEVSPRSGNHSRNVPPQKSTIRTTPRTNPGSAKPASTAIDDSASKREPSRTAFAMPSGIESR